MPVLGDAEGQIVSLPRGGPRLTLVPENARGVRADVDFGVGSVSAPVSTRW